MTDSKVSIRRAAPADSNRITELCLQLGYETFNTEVHERLLKIVNKDDTALFAAELNGQVVGWIQVSIRSAIETGEVAEITGLVVDESVRGKGIGKSLVIKTEEWAESKGYSSIRVRTNVKRTETHLFYKGIGFEENKKQTVFQKRLDL